MAGDKIRIGKIVGCHGLRGDLKIRPASEDPDWVGRLKTAYLGEAPDVSGTEAVLEVATSRHQGNLVLVRFAGYDSRTLAEPLVGRFVFADLNVLPPPDEGEYWAHDLIGLDVLDHETRRRLGVVVDLLSSGGSDFLEVQLDGSAETAVIPFIDQFFPEVDVNNRTVTVDLLGDFLTHPPEPVTADRLEE